MTFADLVILARHYLNDLRTPEGVMITSAGSDGIRWTSTKVQFLCSSALQFLLRTLTALEDKSAYINDASFSRIIQAKISAIGVVTDIPEDITIYKLIALQEVLTPSNIYTPVAIENFFGERYRNISGGASDIGLNLESRVCVQLLVEDKPIIKVAPIPDEEVNIEIICKADLSTFSDITSTKKLPFVGLDDLILTVIKFFASIIEHDLETMKILDGKIKMDLSLLGVRENE
jgi:hypothetical protein